MSYKIIAADPSPTVQKALQSAFSEPEFRLFPFEDGAEVLDATIAIRPDALLLSVSLPGRDGYEVARALRRQIETRRTPVFFLKGTFEALDPEKVSLVDHEGIVVKPFDSARLVSEVRGAIERRTTPATLPEEPLLDPADSRALAPHPKASGAECADSVLSGRPAAGRAGRGLNGAEGTADLHARIREWVRAEIYEMERELEKRIKARVLAEIRESRAGDNPGSSPGVAEGNSKPKGRDSFRRDR